MSTKALEKLVGTVECSGEVVGCLRCDALEELKNIRHAAKALHEDMDPRVMSHAPRSLHDAMGLMTDISREEP